ncbi:hypothetical protein FH972_005171 [Carpinus fangiana]|uniref:Uncharacterized protein n=1 Tax=Carpinus fangiana TaxID=176857 RepID=A0A5N6QRQ1_9ROSI|nr:hypothetical protein FH972_005171 [Carpinus fangiana]
MEHRCLFRERLGSGVWLGSSVRLGSRELPLQLPSEPHLPNPLHAPHRHGLGCLHLLAPLPPQRGEVPRHRRLAHPVKLLHRRQHAPLQPCPQHLRQEPQQAHRRLLRQHRGQRLLPGPTIRHRDSGAILPGAQEHDRSQPHLQGQQLLPLGATKVSNFDSDKSDGIFECKIAVDGGEEGFAIVDDSVEGVAKERRQSFIDRLQVEELHGLSRRELEKCSEGASVF